MLCMCDSRASFLFLFTTVQLVRLHKPATPKQMTRRTHPEFMRLLKGKAGSGIQHGIQHAPLVLRLHNHLPSQQGMVGWFGLFSVTMNLLYKLQSTYIYLYLTGNQVSKMVQLYVLCRYDKSRYNMNILSHISAQ